MNRLSLQEIVDPLIPFAQMLPPCSAPRSRPTSGHELQLPHKIVTFMLGDVWVMINALIVNILY